MHIFIHDYAGHPFVLPLSERLALRNYQVTHAWCASLAGPQASFSRNETFTLKLRPLGLKTHMPRAQLIRRVYAERQYGRALSSAIEASNPDVVISSNAPIDVQTAARTTTAQIGAKFVYWMQDIYWVAMRAILPTRLPLGGASVARVYRLREASLWNNSDFIIPITEDFAKYLEMEGIRTRFQTIQNWAPIEQLPVVPRVNDWSESHQISKGFNFIYTGTLAMKHDPRLLLELARSVASRGGRVVVLAEGPGPDWLFNEALHARIENLMVLPFEPFERIPEVMGAADVLVALLTEEASEFSVPSKILSYLCASRPILGAIPPNNLASRIVLKAGAGIMVEPSGPDTFISAAEKLMDSKKLRTSMGRRGRKYAQEHFDIDSIADQFEHIVNSL